MDQPLADTTHHQDEEWHYLWWTTTMFRVMSYLQLVIYEVNKKVPTKIKIEWGKENTKIKSNQFKLVITVRFWPTCNTIKLSDAITLVIRQLFNSKIQTNKHSKEESI